MAEVDRITAPRCSSAPKVTASFGVISALSDLGNFNAPAATLDTLSAHFDSRGSTTAPPNLPQEAEMGEQHKWFQPYTDRTICLHCGCWYNPNDRVREYIQPDGRHTPTAGSCKPAAPSHSLEGGE